MNINSKPILHLSLYNSVGQIIVEKDVEIKKTRSLVLFYNSHVKRMDTNEREIQKTFLDAASLREDIELLGEKRAAARDDFFNDSTNAEKEAKFRKLDELFKEKQNQIFENDGIAEKSNKIQKDILDIYEKCIIESIKEQGIFANPADAEQAYNNFVEEQGVAKASEWIWAIGQYLFGDDEEESPFLAAMREKQNKAMQRPRNQK